MDGRVCCVVLFVFALVENSFKMCKNKEHIERQVWNCGGALLSDRAPKLWSEGALDDAVTAARLRFLPNVCVCAVCEWVDGWVLCVCMDVWVCVHARACVSG